MPMTTIRIFYSKTGRAKYISHLDTMRAVTRALRRCGLPLWYTEGYNPHLYLTFALPISLGYESLRESFDIRLMEDMDLEELASCARAVMPAGFDVLEASLPEMDPKSIMWADYDIRLIYRPPDMEIIRERFDSFNRQPVIDVVKKTKKGEKTVDIRPLAQNLSTEWSGDCLQLKLRIASGLTVNINPTLYLKAFYSWSGLDPEGVRITRTAILDENLREFR